MCMWIGRCKSIVGPVDNETLQSRRSRNERTVLNNLDNMDSTAL